MYKVVNAENSEVVIENLDFYQARAHVENHIGDLTVMEQDADVADRLARRQQMLQSPAFIDAED